MVLNRKTDRRRRLLVDSSSLVGETDAVVAKKTKRSTKEADVQTDVRKAYAIGARRRHQRKVTDLIPKRRLAYSFSIVAFAFLLAGVNLLAYFAPGWQSVIGRQGVEALAVTGPSSLTTFLSTVFFATAAVLCLLIYALRQHRCDDYEGTYRVWGWLAPAFAIASLGCILPLAAISQNIFVAVTGRGFSVSWLPMAIGVALVSLLLIRYLMEVRYSYGTIAWAGLAWLAICTSWAMPEILTAFAPGVDQSSINDWALGNGLLVTATATLLANLTYARFVFLRSNGFIHAKPKQIKAKATLPFKALRERSDTRRSRAARKAAATGKESAAEAEPAVATKPKKSRRKAPAKSATASKSRKAAATKTAEPVAKPKLVKETAAPVAAAPAEPPVKKVSASASERLKQLAAASRIQKTPDQASTEEPPATVKMSKAQRRKLRKQQKKQNRAA